MNRVLTAITLLSIVLIQGPVLASDDPPLLVGGDEDILLVRPRTEQVRYDLVKKEADHLRWVWVDKDSRGTPVAAVIASKHLHLVFRKPLDHVYYDSQGGLTPGHRPQDPNFWPEEASPIALCEAPKTSSSTQSFSLITAVVARNADASADESTPRKVILGVFQRSSQGWTHLIDYPRPVELSKVGRVLAASVKDALFVIAGEPGAAPSVLATLRNGQWTDVPTAGWSERSEAIGLLSIRGQLVAVLASDEPSAAESKPAGRVLHLAIYDNQEQRFFLQPIAIDGEPIAWEHGNLPLVGRLGERVAMVWRNQKLLKYTTCGINGQALPAAETDILERGPTDQGGLRVLDVFVWVLTVAIIIPAIFMRPRTLPKPFTLPETMRPGNLLKRLLAAVIDFLPWATIGPAVFQIKPISQEKLQTIIEEKSFPPEYAYAIVTVFVLHTAYCIVTELKFGATVGKKLMRLRVVADDGNEPGVREILLRNLVRNFEMIAPIILPLVALLLIAPPLFTRNRQRLGDIMGRTAVIDAAFTPSAESDNPQAHEDDTASSQKPGGQDQ